MPGAAGFAMAEVSPRPSAMPRKVWFTTARFGSPKLTFESPQIVLIPASRRHFSMKSSDTPAASGFAEMVMISASATKSAEV